MKIKTKPFSVPNFILEEIGPNRSLIEARGFPLSAFDADELSAKCDEYRAAIFKKAGKPDPKAKP